MPRTCRGFALVVRLLLMVSIQMIIPFESKTARHSAEPSLQRCPLLCRASPLTRFPKRWAPYLLGTVGIAPTRWVFGGRRHCCVICAQCVSRRGGGGVCRIYSESPSKGLFGTPGSARCTDDMFAFFVRFGQGLCCLLPLFVNRGLPCPHTNSLHRLLLPPMHHRNLWCAKERALGGKVAAGEPR